MIPKTYDPETDNEIIVQFLEPLTFKNSEQELNFEKGKFYKLPKEMALQLQDEGYCLYTEKVKSIQGGA